MKKEKSFIKKLLKVKLEPCFSCHRKQGKPKHTCPYLCEHPNYDFDFKCNCCNDCIVDCSHAKKD